MSPDDFLRFFKDARACAILRTTLRAAAAPAMDAAIRGGFRVCEFTLGIPGALDLIAEFAKRRVVVGAGTVLTAAEAHAAVDAGAKFLVSPVVDDEVIAAAAERRVAMMPGTFTPTEMLRAHRAGARLQKLFPAPGTGPKYVRAILGPMPFLNIVPTNGVDEHNAADWLEHGAFAVGFVNTVFDPDNLASGNYLKIEERARAAIRAVGG